MLRNEQIGMGDPWGNALVFQGRRAQRGFGFGSFLSSIGRFALPIVKNIGKKVFKQAVEIGKDVIVHGKSPKESLKSRGKDLVKDILTTDQQKGSGLQHRRKRKRLNAKWISTKRTRRV